MDAAKRFFARSLEVVGHAPGKVTTDGHDAYPRAIREILGEGVSHRCSRYMNNRIERDHRGITGRYQPMRGFGTFVSAARFCTARDEARDHVRHRTRVHEAVPLRGAAGVVPRPAGRAAGDGQGSATGQPWGTTLFLRGVVAATAASCSRTRRNPHLLQRRLATAIGIAPSPDTAST